MNPETLELIPQPDSLEALIVVAGVVLLRQLFEFAGKQILDSATGWRAGLRRLFKTLAVYTSNKE